MIGILGMMCIKITVHMRNGKFIKIFNKNRKIGNIFRRFIGRICFYIHFFI
jgi:hypothetical protein